MITISTIKNSAGAATYFSKEDNYYLSEVDAKENSIWWGIGANKLKLSNKKVLKEDLQEIMEGRLPNGVTIGSQKNGKDGSVKHRPGYNICFNAPKSVSILALDGGDKKFYEAHLEAVKETLKTIEKDCAQSRVHNGEKVSFENTKNLTIALIRHTASRSLDPHLHHHALVMNATEKEDKTWKALSSNKISKTNKTKNRVINGFSERIYHNQIYYGLIYRSALANKVKDLGCEIEVTGKHGMWEIKGVPKEAREAMSKRRKEIEELLDKLNYHSFKAADLISAKSRDDKPKDINLAEMKQTWKQELASVGFSSKEFLAELDNDKKSKKNKDIKNNQNNQNNKNKNLEEDSNTQKNNAIGDAIKTVKDATWYLSQYKLRLNYTKIISQALEFSIGKTTHKDIVHAVNQLIKDGFIISLDNHDNTFVTKELIETEKTIMDFVDSAKNKWSGVIIKDNSNIIANEIKENGIKKSEIKRDEIHRNESEKAEKNVIEKNKKYAIDILQSKHRLSLVESNRSDNKDLIANILELAESSGKIVRVLSPNRLTTNEINVNITRNKPTNIWQWLISLGKPEVGESIAGFKHKYKEEVELPTFLLRLKQEKDVIVVNSAETLGCDDIRTLLELTEKSKARVIFLQDTTDKRGFGAGNPIETLKQAGIERFKLETPKINTTGVIPKLITIKNNDKRTLQLAGKYAQREDKDRENTVILVNSKNQLKTTNDAIRNELKKRGKISDSEYTVSVLNPVYMSKPEAILAHKYQQGMIIRFYDSIPVDWDVEYCDRETNTLRLIQNKRRMAWNPKKQQDKVKYGVFKKETLQIAKGDKLIATSNMRDLEIKNGTKFTVGEINSRKRGESEKIIKSIELLFNTKEIKEDKGTKEATNIKEPKKIKVSLADLKNSHFQYDYATTINRFSKKPVDNIIADFKAYSLDKPTISELIKQAEESLTIFTNNSKAAQKRLGHIPAKLTATEMLLDTSKTIPETDDKDRKTLGDKNNKTIAEIKSSLEAAMGNLKNQYEFRSQDKRKAVDFAIEKITSRNAGFTNADLEKEALEYALKELISKQNKKVTLDDIRNAIEEKHVSGKLVIGKNLGDGAKWTTKEMLELERSIIADLKKGKSKLAPLLDPKTLKIPTKGIKLTKDQKNAISLITTTKDQYVIVQGYAGTGKTTMFSQVHKMLKENNNNINNTTQEEIKKIKKVKILGLAPTHKAVKELKAVGIKAQSLKSFLIEQKKLEKDQNEQKKQGGQKDWLDRIEIANKNHNNSKVNILDNKLIILDEISMVSNKEFAEFVEITGKSKSHVVLSGDVDQYPSIGSGKPIEIAQKSNILKIAFLKEIIRQKNIGLKEAVKSTINGNYAYALDKIEKDNPQNHIERINPETNLLKNQSNLTQSNLGNLDFEFFKNLQKSIIEIDNNELKPGEKTLEQMVAEDFLTRTQEIRDETVVIVHANKDRAVINKYIREGLKEQGVIKKTGVMVNCLTAKGLTNTEHKSLTSYNSGNVVKLANKYYHITKVDLESKSLLLKDGAGKTKYFYPEKETDKYNMELYSSTKEELAIGDVIRLTKSDKKRGLFANFEYQVKAIDEKQVILESKDSNSSKNKETEKGTEIGAKKIKEKSQIILNHKKLKDSHWDYAQTVTGHGIQGGSKKYVIAFEVSYRKFLANVRSFYISISRAIEHITIYTDDKTKFLKQLLRNSGDKYSALEITGELEKFANNIKNSKQITKSKEKLNTTIYDVKEIRRSLEKQAETIVERLLGRPNEKLSSSKEWRYGNKGSLVISMTQAKRGLWKSFETGESGNLISLLQKELGLNFPETLKYASNMFGDFQKHMQLQETKINKVTANTGGKNKNTIINSEKSKTSEYAQRLAKESSPVAGTIVEKYLKKHRGIKNIESNDIRYHPKVFTGKNEKQKYLPAMLSIGRDKDGNVQCVQATYLDPKIANKADLIVKKRTYASPSGALVSLQKDKYEIHHKNNNKNDKSKNKISFVTEGTETGLSIKDAVTNIKNSQAVVTLGKSNFNSIDPKSIGNQVIFCLDNDGPKTFTDNTIHKAAKRLIGLGKEVFIAIPQFDGKNNKKVDFNDIAKTAGTVEVRNRLENSIPYKEWTSVRGTEINPHTIEKVMQPKNTNFNSQGLLPQKPDISLDIAAKFINSEKKSSFDKYLNTYDQMQHSLSEQKIADIPKIDMPDTQKDLPKIEKELY